MARRLAEALHGQESPLVNEHEVRRGGAVGEAEHALSPTVAVCRRQARRPFSPKIEILTIGYHRMPRPTLARRVMHIVHETYILEGAREYDVEKT